MLSDPLTITLGLLIVIILGFILWFILLRNPLIPIISTLVIFIFLVLFPEGIFGFEIGSYHVIILDILSIFLLSVTVGNIVIFPQKRKVEYYLVIVMGVLLFVSWLRGTLSFGLEMSTNSFRTYFYFFAVLFYTINIRFSETISTKIFTCVKTAILITIIIALVRWGLVALGEVSNYDWIAPDGKMVRVLNSSATFLLLQFLFINLFTRKTNEKKIQNFLMSAAILGMIFLLQQRTVWVALVFCSIIFILLNSKVKNIVILFILLITVITSYFLTINNFSIEDLTGTSLDLRNLNWRIEGWQALLTPERFNSPLEFIIGQPFGSGYERYILDSSFETTVSPHNFYIQTFLNIGAVGLLTLLLLYGITLYKLLRNQISKMNQLFIVLLSSQLVFFLSYSPSFEQGIIVGMALLFIVNNNNKLVEVIEICEITQEKEKHTISVNHGFISTEKK